MPTLLVIRLHPNEAIEAEEFEKYLDGLSIEAHELSFDDPAGIEVLIDTPTATYRAPTWSDDDVSFNHNELLPQYGPTPVIEIAQHFNITPPINSIPPSPLPFTRTKFSVATAVIEIPDPPAGGEHKTSDVRIVIRRSGSEIIHKQKYYNVPVAPAPMPGNPNDFPGLAPSLDFHSNKLS